MLRHNIPPWLLTCEEFKFYVQVVSRGAFRLPTRHGFLQLVADFSERLKAEITQRLEGQLFISMEEDAWTRHNKHYHAVTNDCQGESRFIGCFDIEKGEESAENQAGALNLNPCLNPRDDSIPERKVAAVTTDTTNVMPATVRHLGSNCRLFLNCFWVPCLHTTWPFSWQTSSRLIGSRTNCAVPSLWLLLSRLVGSTSYWQCVLLQFFI
jgi:hypothetical protein